jgi:two-component system, cell cycle sensor histidine kinase and response regulator CckA
LNPVTPPAQVQLLGRDDEETARSGLKRFGLLAAATLLSLAILWFATESLILIGSTAGIMVAALGLVDYIRRTRSPADANDLLPPDWSVTHAAAQLSNAAIAISDRAGRLVCANDHFTRAFAGLSAPPDLPVDAASRELLVAAARAAWRDGDAQIDSIAHGENRFSVKVARAGTADEYLLWRLASIERLDVESKAIELIAGRIGRAMAESGVMAVTIAGDGRIRAANAAFALRATGSAAEPITGRDFAAFMRMDEKGSIFFEREGRRGLPIRLLHVPLTTEGEQGASLLLAIDEEGPRVERGAALAHVEQLLSTLPLGLALVDRDGRFLFANDSFARVIDIPADQLPPYPADLVIPEDKAAVLDSIRRYGGAASSGDIAIRLKERSDEVIALSIAGVRGLGEASVLLGLKDNSEENRLKRQVAQQTKMESIGQLAGGVAHDFNNILTAIIGYCDLMLLRHEPGDSDYDDIQQIKNNSNRAASLTRQLLAFSRQQTLRPQILQLDNVVADIASLLKRLLGETVRLELHHGRGMGPVRADPGQLEQVIINLGVNARDAMPKGGVVHISTKAVSVEEVRAMGSDILPIGDYVLLSVEDSGVGIPKENLAKIFEPFFTTKEVGKGTGLGLSTVYGIVKQSGGFIFAESEPGQGTRFDIYLPVHTGEIPSNDGGKREFYKPKDLWGSGRVLLVEDEDMVRAVAERALVRQGYVVETATDGEEALALFADGKRYDLVVSDVVMPNLDGPSMARELRARYGEIRLLFMSGYAEEELRETIAMENVSFLPKPFSVQQIAEAVREALGRDETQR